MENTNNNPIQKSAAAEREERVLGFWKEQDIFKKTLEKESPEGPFVFYEGPPTANGKPGIHHLEARAFKDVIPRYKTMQGYSVRRKGGWDTHGLPVELAVEKELGLKSKKEIEEYGIALFNKKCKESVWMYVDLWTKFTDRIGYWVDQKDPYVTYHNSYIESVWNILGKVEKDGLLYKDYKVLPWCPRCGTALSSHELAQGYADVKDLSAYVKFKVKAPAKDFSESLGRLAQPDIEKIFGGSTSDIFLVAWTTTPWTLPGNVGLAVGEDVEYVKVKKGNDFLILAKGYLQNFEGEYEIVAEIQGKGLIGLEYEPLYPFLSEQISGIEKEKLSNAYKVYAADFVTTTDGTGIVHIAPMYGADDFELGTKAGLPKFHTVADTGHFIKGTSFLEGRFVKDEETAVEIIKDLAHRGLLFKKEKYEHSYPHCWRCKTPLIYYARDSWYIRMSELRDQLVSENEKINWEPAHIKHGRFGEWLREIKDWAISRERYWGTPLPIWVAEDGERLVADSVNTLKQYGKKSGNNYFVMRHCQTENNLKKLWSFNINNEDVLTVEGKEKCKENIAVLADKKIDLIVASPYSRTQQTAALVAEALGMPKESIIIDARLGEWRVGGDFDGRLIEDYFKVRNAAPDRYQFKTADGESYADVLRRSGECLYEIDAKYKNKNILFISHGGAARALMLHGDGYSFDTLFTKTRSFKNFDNAEIRQLSFVPLPHNDSYELDLHRPYIDSVVLEKDVPASAQGSGTAKKEFRRVKEVLDVWFDSGAMPFAQDHYPFENKEFVEEKNYPADFISEAIDQTRGWFYTLHAIGVLMGRGRAYKNVICLGLLLDSQGKKMSKSLGNIVDPWEQIEKYGVDALRLWMYSVNQPGDSKNYDEKTVDELVKKVFNLTYNVLSFYDLYRDQSLEADTKIDESEHVLDQWILARLSQFTALRTENLDTFKLFEPVRALRDFVDDLSTWYLRRSRERIKEGDKEAKQTLYRALKTLAKIMAPFAPFTAEDLWQQLRTAVDEESVHMAGWPKAGTYDVEVLAAMQTVRDYCATGNMLRKKETIPVRQPLATFFVPEAPSDAYQEIMRDELNVKSIEKGDGTISFDTTITPELQAEGNLRELIRAVQDKRKEKNLLPKDLITLRLPSLYKETVTLFEAELKKSVAAREIMFTEAGAIEIA